MNNKKMILSNLPLDSIQAQYEKNLKCLLNFLQNYFFVNVTTKNLQAKNNQTKFWTRDKVEDFLWLCKTKIRFFLFVGR